MKTRIVLTVNDQQTACEIAGLGNDVVLGRAVKDGRVVVKADGVEVISLPITGKPRFSAMINGDGVVASIGLEIERGPSHSGEMASVYTHDLL